MHFIWRFRQKYRDYYHNVMEARTLDHAIYHRNHDYLKRVLITARRFYRDHFMKAIFTKSTDVFEIMLQSGYDLNTFISTGDTGLHLACKDFRADIVEFLLNRGANPNLRNLKNMLPIETLAMNYEHIGREYLQSLSMGSPKEIDEQNFRKKEECMLRTLDMLKLHGVVLDEQNRIHSTVMDRILPNATRKLVQLFKTWEFDFNIPDLRYGNCTLLHYVAEIGNVDVADELLSHIDINSKSGKGTPLHIAAYFGQVKFVQFCIDNGADMDAGDEFNTPLYNALISLDQRSLPVFKTLVEYRSGVNSIVLLNLSLLDFVSSDTNYNVVNKGKLLTIARHLVEMKVAEFYVPSKILTVLPKIQEACGAFKISEFEAECANEIELLKQTRFCADLNMYQFMKKQSNYTEKYVNKFVVEDFDSPKYRSRFPLYCDTLYVAYRVAHKRRQIVDDTLDLLFNYLSPYNVPHTALRDIISYLSFQDLKHLKSFLEDGNNFIQIL